MSYRLAVSGSAGTGKSTLAEKLANRLDLPYVDEGFRRRLDAGLDPHKLSRIEMRNLILELYILKSFYLDYLDVNKPNTFLLSFYHNFFQVNTYMY